MISFVFINFISIIIILKHLIK